MANTPGPEWYREINKSRVRRDLDKTNLKEKLGYELEAFIKFAANQRFNYKEDIYAEYEEFKNRRKRLSKLDIESWNIIRKNVFRRDNYTCQYCGKKGGVLEVDHIIPFSKGGKENMSNLLTSCKTCNRKKHDKTPKEAGMTIINDPRGEAMQ